eukprot:TRINITY_DN4642_c2_g1_i1.p1 TRINITY_DN4642_c2_g1~~TRINITY_DN4642_c2_g1_i1.p1  ORF type:complete len:334 (+),score=138.29 TRINITY_DN4642_c2_g1_i1:3-1004(+)
MIEMEVEKMRFKPIFKLTIKNILILILFVVLFIDEGSCSRYRRFQRQSSYRERGDDYQRSFSDGYQRGYNRYRNDRNDDRDDRNDRDGGRRRTIQRDPRQSQRRYKNNDDLDYVDRQSRNDKPRKASPAPYNAQRNKQSIERNPPPRYQPARNFVPPKYKNERNRKPSVPTRYRVQERAPRIKPINLPKRPEAVSKPKRERERERERKEEERERKRREKEREEKKEEREKEKKKKKKKGGDEVRVKKGDKEKQRKKEKEKEKEGKKKEKKEKESKKIKKGEQKNAVKSVDEEELNEEEKAEFNSDKVDSEDVFHQETEQESAALDDQNEDNSE